MCSSALGLQGKEALLYQGSLPSHVLEPQHSNCFHSPRERPFLQQKSWLFHALLINFWLITLLILVFRYFLTDEIRINLGCFSQKSTIFLIKRQLVIIYLIKLHICIPLCIWELRHKEAFRPNKVSKSFGVLSFTGKTLNPVHAK